MPKVKLKRGELSPTCLKYATDRPGQIIYLNDMVNAIPAHPQTIQATMLHHVRSETVDGLEIVQSGQAWRYVPNKPTSAVPNSNKRMFEELGQTKRNTIILQDDAGNLFEATEL